MRHQPRTPEEEPSFIPALGHHVFTPVYDVVSRLVLPERRFKSKLIEDAALRSGMRLLDVGCGTGTLLVLVSAAADGLELVGLDADDRILRRARHKLAEVGANAQFDRGSAETLPYADSSFDRVFTTLTLHHLTIEQKTAAFAEALRVLRPGGELHVGDFGAPDSLLSRVASFLTEAIGGEHVHENYRGLLPVMAREAGFVAIEETAHFATIFGMLRCFRASKPAGAVALSSAGV
jgi:ubiquinone/menaquinone biosynthesis C-methylase UbiE